ncbi:MAG: glycosyltransferase family 39 protein [Anaerolineae bacterium]|nr:glycosyltransferase family 39 protein [Anaerolineae bacterium]MCB9107831.1 glycosyltransferase family 39 protein [Anaerolineales bacterium]
MTTNNAKIVTTIFLPLLIFSYSFLAIIFTTVIPLSKAPDEYVHYLYIRFIADNGRPPINLDEQQAAGYKSDQPPLYHALVALLTGGIDTSGPPSFKFTWEPHSRQLIDIGLPRAILVRTADETWPYQSGFLAWFAGRWVSVGLSGLVILITYFIVLEIFPHQPWLALATAGTLAFLPRFIFTGSVLSDENLVGVGMALFFWAIVRIVKYPNCRLRWYALVGVLIGLLILTKYSTIFVPFELFIVLLWLAKKQPHPIRYVWVRLTVAGVLAVSIVSVWFGFIVWHFNRIQDMGIIRGILYPILVGDGSFRIQVIISNYLSGKSGPTNELKVISEPSSVVTEGGWLDWFHFLFEQFWHISIFGIEPPFPLGIILLPALLLCVLATFGWWRRWQRNDGRQRMWLAVLLLHVAIFTIIPLINFVMTQQIYDTAQARHILFPAGSALGILLVAGVAGATSPRWQPVAMLGTMSFALILSLAQLYYFYIGFPAPLPVRTEPNLAAAPALPLSIDFDDGLHLQGFDWQLSKQNVLALNLYWLATALSRQDYRTEITLQPSSSAEPALRWISQPAQGRFPTRAWEVGDSIQDRLDIPLTGLAAGTYTVNLRLLDWNDEPLPSAQGNKIPLTRLQLAESSTPAAVTLWQTGEPVTNAWPTYRYRATIPVTTPPGQTVTLVGPDGQPFSPIAGSDALRLFMVDYDWPSGVYELDRNGSPTGVQFEVANFDRNFTPPEMDHVLNANFNDEVMLLGYDLPTRRIESGSDGIPLVLYWQSLNRIENNYIIFDRLLDETQQPWGGYDRLPKETYPTYLWVPGEVIADGFAVPVDPAAPDGIYTIDIGLYPQSDTQAVPLPLLQDGLPSGKNSVRLGPLKIGRSPAQSQAAAEIDPQTPLRLDLGDPPVIRLSGYSLTSVADSGTMSVTLYWESLAPTPVDWSIFVHLRDQAGNIVAQKDGPAGGGPTVYPTSLWDAGEVIIDEIVMPLPDDPALDQYTLVVGLYNLADFSRLTVPDSPNNEIILTTWPPS